MKTWALIKYNKVYNKIVADDSFIDLIRDKWDYIIDLTDINPEPDINQFYDSDTNIFSIAAEAVVGYDHPVDTPVIPNFEPFMLTADSGGFTVSTDGVHVTIGCRVYDPDWLKQTVSRVLSTAEPGAAIIVVSELGSDTELRPFAVVDLQSILNVLQ